MPHTASPIWRDMASTYETLRRSSWWLPGIGDKSFWLDNWLSESLVGPQPVDALLTIAQGKEIFADLKHLIPERLHTEINDVVLTPECPD